MAQVKQTKSKMKNGSKNGKKSNDGVKKSSNQLGKKKGSKKEEKKKSRSKIVDRYTEKLIKDLRVFRRKDKQGKVTAKERYNMKRREKSAVGRMIKAAGDLIMEANKALNKLVDNGLITLGVQRVQEDFGKEFSLNDTMSFNEIFETIQGASVFLNDPETAYLTAARVTRNSELKERYDELYKRLKSGNWKDNGYLSDDDMKRVFANYRRIEEEKYSLISGDHGKEVYGSENVILFMIEVRKQGGDELLAAHQMLEEFEDENLPEYKALVKMRGEKAKRISGMFSDRGIYGRLGKLL